MTWIRLFKPLLSAGLPQGPANVGLKRLGFVKEAYRRLDDIDHLTLRVGTRFSSERSADLHQALKDAANNIKRIPATHMTYQGGARYFR